MGSVNDMRASQAFSNQANFNVLDESQSDFTNADPMRGSMYSAQSNMTQMPFNPFAQEASVMDTSFQTNANLNAMQMQQMMFQQMQMMQQQQMQMQAQLLETQRQLEQERQRNSARNSNKSFEEDFGNLSQVLSDDFVEVEYRSQQSRKSG